MPAGQLGIVFALTSNAAGLSRGFQQANREMSGFQQRARAFGRAAAIPLAAVGVAGARAAVQLVNEFDQAQKTITQQTGATGAELQGLTDDMRAAFGQVPQSMGEVAEALGTINTRFGSTGQALQEQTRLFLDFSRVTGTEVSTAVSTLAAQLTNFGEPASSLNETLGDMVRIQQETGLAGADMARQFNEYGPLFANLNLTVEQTAAVFGQLARSNIAVSRVAPGLNAFIRNTAALGKDPADGPACRGGRDSRCRRVHRRHERGDAGIRGGGRPADDDGDPGGQLRPAGLQRAPRQGRGARAGAGRGDADPRGAVLQDRQPDQGGRDPGSVGFRPTRRRTCWTRFREEGFGPAVSQAFEAIRTAGGRVFGRFADWARDNRVLAGGMTLVAGAALTVFARTHPLIATFAALATAWTALQGDNLAVQLLAIAGAAAVVGVNVYRAVAAFPSLGHGCHGRRGRAGCCRWCRGCWGRWGLSAGFCAA